MWNKTYFWNKHTYVSMTTCTLASSTCNLISVNVCPVVQYWFTLQISLSHLKTRLWVCDPPFGNPWFRQIKKECLSSWVLDVVISHFQRPVCILCLEEWIMNSHMILCKAILKVVLHCTRVAMLSSKCWVSPVDLLFSFLIHVSSFFLVDSSSSYMERVAKPFLRTVVLKMGIPQSKAFFVVFMWLPLLF